MKSYKVFYQKDIIESTNLNESLNVDEESINGTPMFMSQFRYFIVDKYGESEYDKLKAAGPIAGQDGTLSINITTTIKPENSNADEITKVARGWLSTYRKFIIQENVISDVKVLTKQVKDFSDELKSKYNLKDIKLFYYPESKTEDVIVINYFEVSDKNNGTGTKVMNDIIDFADDNSFILTLDPSNKFGSSVKRLKEFYKRFGFIENKDRKFSETFIRYPNKVNEGFQYLQESVEVNVKNIQDLVSQLVKKYPIKKVGLTYLQDNNVSIDLIEVYDTIDRETDKKILKDIIEFADDNKFNLFINDILNKTYNFYKYFSFTKNVNDDYDELYYRVCLSDMNESIGFYSFNNVQTKQIKYKDTITIQDKEYLEKWYEEFIKLINSKEYQTRRYNERNIVISRRRNKKQSIVGFAIVGSSTVN